MLVRIFVATGVTMIVLGAAAWFASLYIVSYRGSLFAPDTTITLWRGELWVTTGGTYMGPGFSRLRDTPEWSNSIWWTERIGYSRTALTGGAHWDFYMPLWLVPIAGVVAAGVPLGAAAAQRWRRQKAHNCVDCGYDLSGAAGACPECGQVMGSR
ncbi:MAG: hypothetical protein ACREJO_05420 [Phycisphaerales bacterium]